MKGVARKTQGVIEGIGGLLLMALAMALPAFYFLSGWELHGEHLRTETQIYSRQVSSVIGRNPDMWKYEGLRFSTLLRKRLEDTHVESFRILDLEGNIVARREEENDWPRMTRRYPLMDSGEPVGFLEVSASLRPLAGKTAVLAAASTGVTLLLFLLFRTYPTAPLRAALDMLSHEKRRASVVLQSIGDGVISTDPEDRILIVNRMGEKITGWTQAEAFGRPVGEVFHPEGEVLVDRKGVSRRIETGTFPALDDNGRSVGSVLVFRDVTEKARVEAALTNAQKLESLGVLAGGIAHEIRNPLSSVNISISSIERSCEASRGLEPETKDKIDRILEQMKSASAKMGLVVQRVMDYSKPFPPRKEIVDLNKIVEEAVRLSLSTLRKRDIAVLRDLAPDLVMHRVDAQMIEQVIVNLITNACQAMEGFEGEKILEIGSAVRDGRIVLRVSDSGPGVPLHLREKVFDPFFTTRKDGSGIGLSFSHRIVVDHGGTIHVDTSRWGGAEFRIELPVAGEGGTG